MYSSIETNKAFSFCCLEIKAIWSFNFSSDLIAGAIYKLFSKLMLFDFELRHSLNMVDSEFKSLEAAWLSGQGGRLEIMRSRIQVPRSDY